ncbi:FtsK/SpoIIIE domain-containing protein (plasmid) [Halopseudomonas sp. SMJS2]|uniref:VirB4 family type IV secretion system protein n=1 Tax=Halopseudomonas sp. SMJS2 TaxID=3041098 RepID=UPI00245321E9|nr:FtsK/SpoIIIE domain-containing protein [Halopseudomonas sp. SMJS2]WGK63521.1 FtsK/SpoIIIE domain-containing protein [Halopseudomonas sp. SMJS2]
MTAPQPHLFDSELKGLGRRGYQGGMPLELLSDAFLFESEGNYFHTVDGRFAKIWRLTGHDISLLNNDHLYGITSALGDVLNKFPSGSSGQVIRHTHRDIRGILQQYAGSVDENAGEFAQAIADSIISRQITASVAKNGFFAKLSPAMMKTLQDEALQDLDEDVRENVSKAITREIREGRFPFVTDIYLVMFWEPSYLFGKFFDSASKAALASVGLVDPNKLAREAYTKQSKEFGRVCHDVAQALASYNFLPEEITGQGYVNWMYQLMNPVRSFEIEPPKFKPELPIYECLKHPDEIPRSEALNRVGTYAWVQTEGSGWTIHDSGHEYYMRSVSVLGKPLKSFPGMIQMAMTGIECESLVTINWHVPGPLVTNTRLLMRGRLLAGKESMKIGDEKTRQTQREDLASVKNMVSSENVNNREQFFDTSIHVTLMGFDEEQLNDQCLQLESLLWRLGHREELRGDAVVRNSLPLNYRPSSMRLLRRDTPHLTGSLSHICPVFLEYQGVADPAILMNNRAGQPIFVDLWGSSVNTAHSLICGTTGSGKSFTFNNLLMGLRVKYRPKVWIIDKGDSYESLCLVLDGNYVRLATEPFEDPVSKRTINPICINPFFIHKDENGNNEMPAVDDIFFITRMLMMMANSGDGSTKVRQVTSAVSVALTYRALESFFTSWVESNPKDEPTFSDFIPTLEAYSFEGISGLSISQPLSLYFGTGPFAALFDGKLQVDWDNDFTVLETQRMANSPALGVVTLALFRQIDMYCKFKLDRARKKIVAVDEAWATLSDPTAAAALASFYRELRRYNAGCLLISQTVKDFVNLVKADSGGGDGQDGILENTSHYFFLSCSESDYQLAKKELAFTDEEIDLWRSLASLPPIYSEVFYRIRTSQSIYYSGVFRLFASAVSLWIASSHPDDYYMRESRTEQIVKESGLGFAEARQKAIVELAKNYPYGARFNVAP